jgi:hypothetical protein
MACNLLCRLLGSGIALLPEQTVPSWLQAHLRGCEECRAHQARRHWLEAEIRRTLKEDAAAYVAPAPLPQPGAVAAARRRRRVAVLWGPAVALGLTVATVIFVAGPRSGSDEDSAGAVRPSVVEAIIPEGRPLISGRGVRAPVLPPARPFLPPGQRLAGKRLMAPRLRAWTDGSAGIPHSSLHLPLPKDDFVAIPLPRLVDESGRQIAAAVENYRREAAVVDPRLARKVTLALKATALSELCDRLRVDAGIQLSAGASVADEKVTLFCQEAPLRDVMRQLSRPFGYAWTRSGKEGAYRYELLQDLKSQLGEEELRNRDRNAALLAVDQEMQRYRPYLALSPGEARARLASATPTEKPLLEHLAHAGWGPVQMYFRLSPRDHDALRAGRRVTFSAVPGPGEQPLPPDLEHGVLQTMDSHRILVQEGRYQSARADLLPQGLPPAEVAEARATVSLNIFASELGQFTLGGYSGFRLLGTQGPTRGDWLATGLSPAVTQPRNEVFNARWSHHPALQVLVTVEPKHICSSSPPHSKATAADVLEALHRATGLPIVGDAYTRLYPMEQVTLRNRRLFAALNQLADTMRLRWNRDGGEATPGRALDREVLRRSVGGPQEWLQFRSTSYFHDRLKEVPNRLLARWSAARRARKILSFDDLVEIAQLPDAQLDASGMAEGARECYGLAEWDLPRSAMVRSHLRLIAELSPALRQQAQSAEGLPFTRLSLSQQQRVLSLALGPAVDQVRSLEDLTGSAVRVDYASPGGFRWVAADNPGMDPWILLPRLFARAPTRAAALQAARRIDPLADDAQIVPTEPALAVIYLLDPRTHLSPSVIRSWSGGVRFTVARQLPPEASGSPAISP